MRNNRILQSEADRVANNNGYYAASFTGHYHDFALYIPLYSDSRPRTTGAPQFILVNKKGEGLYICNFNKGFMGSFDIIDNGIFCKSWKRGELVYNKLMARLESKCYDFKERSYLEYLKSLDANHIIAKNNDLDKQTLFIWLEAANRFNDMIIVNNEQSLDGDFNYVSIR